METTIYLVMGSAGWCEDKVEWPVKAFTDKAAAEAHAEKAKAGYNDCQRRYSNSYGRSLAGFAFTGEEPPWGVNPHDPNMLFRNNGDPDYYVTEIELEAQ